MKSERLQGEVNALWDSVYPTVVRASSVLERGLSGGSLEEVNSQLRGEIEALSESLSTWEVPVPEVTRRQIKEALSIYLDERALSEDWVSPERWSLLQEQLCDVRDGGEHFYTNLNLLRDAPGTHPFIHQLYYFCLESGFRGAYATNEGALEAMRNSLKGWLAAPLRPLSDPPRLRSRALDAGETRGLWSLSPVWLYTLAVVGVILVWIGMAAAPEIHGGSSDLPGSQMRSSR